MPIKHIGFCVCVAVSVYTVYIVSSPNSQIVVRSTNKKKIQSGKKATLDVTKLSFRSKRIKSIDHFCSFSLARSFVCVLRKRIRFALSNAGDSD